MIKRLIPLMVLLVVALNTALPAWAVRTALTPQKIGNSRDGVTAGEFTITFAAADATNFNDFAFTGKEIIIVKNTHATDAKTCIFKGSTYGIPHARSADITESLNAGTYRVFYPEKVGFLQTGNKFWLNGETTDIKIAVIRLP